MKNLQTTGAIGAFIMALAYIVGLGLAFTVLDTSGLENPVDIVRFHVENYALYYLWITLIYVAAGVFLIPLSLALRERLAAADPQVGPLATLATAFGLVWAVLIIGSGLLYNVGLGETVQIYAENPAEAAVFWRLIETVHVGIGASIEIPGGAWTLLVGIAALRSGVFPKALNLFALLIGAAGILTIVPPLMDVAVGLYAIGQIIWWIWMGVSILRNPLEGSV